MTGRRLSVALHRWIGLTSGIVLVIIGLTGSALVFREEIDVALNAQLMRVEAAGRTAAVQDIVDAVQQAFPNSRIFSVRMPNRADAVYEFRLDSNSGHRVFVNPYSGTIIGDRGAYQKLMDLIFYLHSELLAGEIGKTVVGGLALLLLTLLATGVVLWWPGWKHVAAGVVIRWRGGPRLISYDFHKSIGAFAIIFLATAAFTGLSLVFHSAFERTLNWTTGIPDRAPLPKSTAQSSAARTSLDQILRIADTATPGAKTTWVMFPQTAEGPFRVRKRFAEELHPSGKTLVMLDQYSGEVLHVENALLAPLAQRFDHSLYPIHIGQWGGFTSRLLQTFVGVSPLILFVTAWFMWRSRSQKNEADH